MSEESAEVKKQNMLGVITTLCVDGRVVAQNELEFCAGPLKSWIPISI